MQMLLGLWASTTVLATNILRTNTYHGVNCAGPVLDTIDWIADGSTCNYASKTAIYTMGSCPSGVSEWRIWHASLSSGCIGPSQVGFILLDRCVEGPPGFSAMETCVVQPTSAPYSFSPTNAVPWIHPTQQSPYFLPATQAVEATSLSIPVVVGIVLGTLVICCFVLVYIVFRWRYRRNSTPLMFTDDETADFVLLQTNRQEAAHTGV